MLQSALGNRTQGALRQSTTCRGAPRSLPSIPRACRTEPNTWASRQSTWRFGPYGKSPGGSQNPILLVFLAGKQKRVFLSQMNQINVSPIETERIEQILK